MNLSLLSKQLIVPTLVLGLAACSSVSPKPDSADNARAKLTLLQSDTQLATRAPVEIQEAELAVRAAEKPQKDNDTKNHLVLMADRKVEIATAWAQSRLLVDQRKTLAEQREQARLDARTREANLARTEASSARGEAASARAAADRARAETLSARTAAGTARDEAISAAAEADASRMELDAARARSAELQQQITELNAKATDRGLVVTLGDLLFATGKADLKGGATGSLDKLVTFLNKYPDRTLRIEGHTDSVGSDALNRSLSQQRAEAVRTYLTNKGIASERLAATGFGKNAPVASNETATGRQQNRRVEIIISNQAEEISG